MKTMVRIFFYVTAVVSLILPWNTAIPAQAAESLTGKKIVMIIAREGFRDEELAEPQAILEERGAVVVVASSSRDVAHGMLGTEVTPQILLNAIEVSDYDAVIFVGGSGAAEYWDNPVAHTIVKESVAQDKLLCAICIAPVILANAGVLEGKRATVWESERESLVMGGAQYTGTPVETDGKIITASGPASSKAFGYTVAEALENRE